MSPIRLTTIGKIIWFCIGIIVIALIFFLFSLFKKSEPPKIDDDDITDSEKIIDYTENKSYIYDFTDDSEIEDTILIKDSGTYKLTGNNKDHKIVIDSENSVVKIILSNFTTNQVDNLLDIKNAYKVIIELEDNSKNKIVSDELETEQAKNTTIIKSKSNIEFTGSGVLIVEAVGTFIKTDGDILVKGSILEINNINNGINAKGSLKVENGTIYVLADGKGIYSESNINIDNSTFVIRSSGNALKNNGIFLINSGKVFIASGEEIQKPNANSLQKSLILNFKETRKSLFIIHDTAQIVLAYAGGVEYQHLLYSDEFKAESYVLYGSGKIAGTQTYGLYKVEDSEESSQLTCEDLEDDRFTVDNLVNIYDDVVKK